MNRNTIFRTYLVNRNTIFEAILVNGDTIFEANLVNRNTIFSSYITDLQYLFFHIPSKADIASFHSCDSGADLPAVGSKPTITVRQTAFVLPVFSSTRACNTQKLLSWKYAI